MAKYQMKFMFDWGSGICIWSANDAAREKFGYPIETSMLPISEKQKILLNSLIKKYDEALNWRQPSDELLWNDNQRHMFICEARRAYDKLCRELGANYEVIFIDNMFSD